MTVYVLYIHVYTPYWSIEMRIVFETCRLHAVNVIGCYKIDSSKHMHLYQVRVCSTVRTRLQCVFHDFPVQPVWSSFHSDDVRRRGDKLPAILNHAASSNFAADVTLPLMVGLVNVQYKQVTSSVEMSVSREI